MYLKPLHLPKACILVLEEDPKLRATLCGLLIDAGYAIADADSRVDIIDHVDLVLAGIGTSAPSAPLGVLERAIPAIALVDSTAWTGFNFFDAANDLGAVAVLQRPFSRSALLRLMAAVLSQRDTGKTADDHADAAGPADFMQHCDRPHFA